MDNGCWVRGTDLREIIHVKMHEEREQLVINGCYVRGIDLRGHTLMGVKIIVSTEMRSSHDRYDDHAISVLVRQMYTLCVRN